MQWLQKYYLSDKDQQKYFWCYILCICTKIKQIDLEIEAQLVTIPDQRHSIVYRDDSLIEDNSEVAQEQQDALLYKGFLVPPVLGEAEISDAAISDTTNVSIQSIRQKIENLSKTGVLRKYKVKEQWLSNEDDEDFVYLHENGLGGRSSQYLLNDSSMLIFGEFVRKYIIESKFLKKDSSLWPYYKNYSHQKDHSIYHTLVNRFNLTHMFVEDTMFALFESESDIERIRCFEHCSFKENVIERLFGNCQSKKRNESKRKDDQIAIRHKRKYAATLLLQKWNTLRNINILRQQLVVLLSSIIHRMTKELDTRFEHMTQDQMVREAQTNFNEYGKWKKEIVQINKELAKKIASQNSGWQYLSEYDLKDNKPLEICIKVCILTSVLSYSFAFVNNRNIRFSPVFVDIFFFLQSSKNKLS